jgi:hypothetical protein
MEYNGMESYFKQPKQYNLLWFQSKCKESIFGSEEMEGINYFKL